MSERFHLSEAERRFFADNGYVGPFTLYEPEEMARIWSRVRVNILDRKNAPFPKSRLNYDRHLDMPALDAIVSHPRLVDRLTGLLGPDVLCWRTEWFPKYPGDAGTDWHQAQSFVEFEGTEKLVPPPGEPEPWELTAWIAMTDSTRENGCFKLKPGTHRTWYYDEKRNIPFEPEAGVGFYGYDWDRLKLDPTWQPDEEGAIDMELAAGQFFLFTSRCLHGSHPNTSGSSVRFGWATRFVPAQVRVYPERESFQHFGEHLPLDRYASVLVAGEDRHGHNRVRRPMRMTAAA